MKAYITGILAAVSAWCFIEYFINRDDGVTNPAWLESGILLAVLAIAVFIFLVLPNRRKDG